MAWARGTALALSALIALVVACSELVAAGVDARIAAAVGIVLTLAFTAGRLRWMLGAIRGQPESAAS